MINDESVKEYEQINTVDDKNYEVSTDIENEVEVEMGKNPDRWSGKVDPLDKRYVVTLSKSKSLTAAEVLKELVQAHRESYKVKKELNFSSDLADLDKSFELIRNIFLKTESYANSALVDTRNESCSQISRLKSELDSYKLQYDALQASQIEFENLKENQASQIKSFQVQLCEKAAEIKKLTLEISEGEKTLSNYRKWLENSEYKTKELENEISKLSLIASKNKQLIDDIQDKCRIIKDNEFEISKLKTELNCAKSELEQRKADIDGLKSIIALKDTEKDKAVFEATKHLEIRIGVLEAILKQQPSP